MKAGMVHVLLRQNGLKPLKRMQGVYPRAEAPRLYALSL